MARRQVGTAAGRETDDDAYGLARIVALRMGEAQRRDQYKTYYRRNTHEDSLSVVGTASRARDGAGVPREVTVLLAGISCRRRVRHLRPPPAARPEEEVPGDRDHHPVQARRRRRADVDAG